MIFKNYMKLFLKNIKFLIISFSIFFVMLIIFSNPKNRLTEFKAVKLDITINDEDKSEESKNLINYLKEKHNVKEEKIDEENAKKKVFDSEITGYLEIKKDFKEKLKNGEKPVSLIASTKDASITFFKIDLEKYLNYTLAGINSNVSKAEVEKTLKNEVDVKIVDSNIYAQNKNKDLYHFTFGMLSYIVFICIVSILANIEATFKNENLQKRMALAPYSQQSQTMQQFLAQTLIAIVLTTILIIGTTFSVGSVVPKDKILYLFAGVFLFSFTAVAVVQLMVSITKNVKVIGGVSSAFGMIMGFSSGVFLPMQILPKGVVLFSKFMPQYYLIKFFEDVNFNSFLTLLLSQIIFISFYTLLAIGIKKYKLKEAV